MTNPSPSSANRNRLAAFLSSTKRDRWVSFLVLLPSIILLAIFVYGFIAQTIYSSMTDWAGMAENPVINFIGLKNYEKLFTSLLDVRFRQALVNTFFFTVFFILTCLAIGLFLAIMLDRQIRFGGLFRNLFLYPMSLSFIVTGTVWRWLLNPNGGINRLPALIGLEPLSIKWITDRTQIWEFGWESLPRGFVIVCVAGLAAAAFYSWRRGRRWISAIAGGGGALLLVWLWLGGASALATQTSEPHGFSLALIGVVLAATWQMAGYTMAMYLAGLTGIPDELREAARVDGVNEIQLYRYIILPLLQPITLGAVIVLGHISLKIFDLIFVMVGPDNATTDVPGTLMFTTSFRANQFASGAAIAVVMLVMSAVIVVPYLFNTLRSERGE